MQVLNEKIELDSYTDDQIGYEKTSRPYRSKEALINNRIQKVRLNVES